MKIFTVENKILETAYKHMNRMDACSESFRHRHKIVFGTLGDVRYIEQKRHADQIVIMSQLPHERNGCEKGITESETESGAASEDTAFSNSPSVSESGYSY